MLICAQYPAAKSSTPVQVFTMDTLEEGLFRAAEIACEEIELDVDKKTVPAVLAGYSVRRLTLISPQVTLPPLFKEYGSDFGKGKAEQLQWVDKYVPEEKSVQLGLIIRNAPSEITLQYLTYAWESLGRFSVKVGEREPARVPNEEVEDDVRIPISTESYLLQHLIRLPRCFLGQPLILFRNLRLLLQQLPRSLQRKRTPQSAQRSKTHGSCAATALLLPIRQRFVA